MSDGPHRIRCDGHGTQLWNGEAVCECGRVHKLSKSMKCWSCECGREDPLESLNPVCPRCFAQRAPSDVYGPN